MLSFLLVTAALAAPPNSTLEGPGGALTWTTTPSAAGLVIAGSSPKWKVTHQAGADFTPKHTERVDATGTKVVVAYRPDGATVTFEDRVVQIDEDGLWDGDTLDVRLGSLIVADRVEQRFRMIDSSSGKVYGFDSQLVGEESCGASACAHVLVQLTGMLRWVGPSFHYWYAEDGRLLKFDGPAGTFIAPGV
ncbi:MAG: hypothetical protein KC912_16495 [Proteobacteria bacterium]|nr:hypothetical protein [Pseudomonadota bacterium]